MDQLNLTRLDGFRERDISKPVLTAVLAPIMVGQSTFKPQTFHRVASQHEVVLCRLENRHHNLHKSRKATR
jgi:hypothetical protein